MSRNWSIPVVVASCVMAAGIAIVQPLAPARREASGASRAGARHQKPAGGEPGCDPQRRRDVPHDVRGMSRAGRVETEGP
jgi:hypothetical protein